MLKILFIVPHTFVPANSGPKNVIYNLLKYATKQTNCNLIVLLNHDDNEVAIKTNIKSHFPNIGKIYFFTKPKGINLIASMLKSLVHGYPPAIGRYQNNSLTSWLTDHLKFNHYDIIHFDMLYVAQYWKYCKEHPRLLMPHDAYSSKLKINDYRLNFITLIQQLLLRNIEKKEYKKFNTICTVTQNDADFLKVISPELNVKSIGIGVGNEYLNCKPPVFNSNREQANILCTSTGSVSVVPESILKFLQTCYPPIMEEYPNVKLILHMRNLTEKLASYIKTVPSIQHVDYVEDYLAFLKQDWVYVYPQTWGSGLKTKIQQAMALGLPVVGSEQAFNGLEVEHGKHCFVCRTNDDIRASVNKLLGDKELRARIGNAASEHIRSLFSVEIIGERMMSIYHETIRHSSNKFPD
jgi:glycosyltransferase involved in cell wall biosynthesis